MLVEILTEFLFSLNVILLNLVDVGLFEYFLLDYWLESPDTYSLAK